MTYKERLLATLKGESTDQLPFLPRLDLWYRANKRNGTLPSKYKNATLGQILEDMGLGFHAVIPDFQDLCSPDDDVDRALGIYRLWFIPYRAVLQNIERKVHYEGDTTTVEYYTPKGNLRTRVIYDETMKKAGITITHIAEHIVKSKDDLEALGYIFDNIEVLPNYEGYQKFQDIVGENGLAVAYTSLAASPMHLILRELMKMDDFFVMLFNFPDEIHQLERKIEGYFSKVLDVVSNSSAETVLLGANYDSSVTYPPFFKEYITPALNAQSKTLHQKGKFLLTHPDGENEGLLQEYLNSNIDIADSICPAPMTKLGIKEYRDVFGEKITIWGGVPSVIMLEEAMSDKGFSQYIEKFFEDIGIGDHLIVSVADTMPPAAKFERIKLISKIAREFGPVRIDSQNTLGCSFKDN